MSRRASFAQIGRRVSSALRFGKRRSNLAMQQLNIHLLDGSVIKLAVRPTTTVAAVLVAVRHSLSLDLDCDYALYVTTGDSVFVALQNDARVTEVVAGLPASLRGRARFFYKRRLFVPLGQTEELESRCSDPHQAAHRLAYMDAVYHFLHGLYSFDFEQTCSLAALLLQAEVGDYDEARHSADHLVDVLPLTFPESSLGEGNNAPDKIAAQVAALHNELRGLIAMEAQVTFLNKTKVFAAYGCDFFPCKRTWKSRDERASEERVKMRTEEVIVAVGKEGIHLWPTGDADSMSSHSYEVITKWTVSKDGRIFAFCVEDDVIVYLVTVHAHAIESVVEQYVSDLVASRTGGAKTPHIAKDSGSAVVTQVVPPPGFLLPGRFHINASIAEASMASFRMSGSRATTDADNDERKSDDVSATPPEPSEGPEDTTVEDTTTEHGGGTADGASGTASAGPPQSVAAPPPPHSSGAVAAESAAPQAPPIPESEEAGPSGATDGGGADEDADVGADGSAAEPATADGDAASTAAGDGGDDTADAAGNTASDAAEGAGDDADSITAGWVELEADDGTVYYFNEELQESSWLKPRHGQPPPQVDEDGNIIADDAEADQPAEPAPDSEDGAAVAQDGAEALPAGWIEEVDEDGYAYFTNTITGDTQWERPVEAAVASPGTADDTEADAGAEADPEPLPDGWVQLVSDEGDVYYWHEESQESSWTRPDV